MKAGFIGLGNLGKAMVKRLLSQNVTISVWNRTKEKAKDLDVCFMDSPKKLIEENEVIFINLFDSEAVYSVFHMEDGVLAAKLTDKIIIDTTTNHFEKVEYFHKEISDRGGFYIEAPVLGSVAPALSGNLTILVSGDESAYNRAMTYLNILGSTIFYLKDIGMASKVKLINNLLLGVFMAAISEAVVLGERTGIKREMLIDILLKGAGNSMVLNAKKEKLLKEDFSPHFSSALIYKDLHYLQDLARKTKSPMFLGSLTRELYSMTFNRGEDSLDFSAILKLFK